MSVQISATNISSPVILQELVVQSLDKIIGNSHKIVARDLPIKAGQHILAINSLGMPALITFDISDGGRAFLAGLEAMEKLAENRAWLYKLYPALFDDQERHTRAFRVEDLILTILAPTLPPGQRYLSQIINRLRLFTFRPLRIGDELGIYIESHNNDKLESNQRDESYHRFRFGSMEMSNSEDNYFGGLNLPT